jgi:signal-transduction protein with cAMP-binding, CBS, and nucleotidyltransferase domain
MKLVKLLFIVSSNNEHKGIVTEGDILQFQALEFNSANLPVTEVICDKVVKLS